VVMRESPAGAGVLQLRGEVMGENGNKACLLIVTSGTEMQGRLWLRSRWIAVASDGDGKIYAAKFLWA
jgi:hypothetical protein